MIRYDLNVFPRMVPQLMWMGGVSMKWGSRKEVKKSE